MQLCGFYDGAQDGVLCELMDPLQHFSLVNNFLSGTDESSSFFYKNCTNQFCLKIFCVHCY
jgi:hypothetical protein